MTARGLSPENKKQKPYLKGFDKPRPESWSQSQYIDKVLTRKQISLDRQV